MKASIDRPTTIPKKFLLELLIEKHQTVREILGRQFRTVSNGDEKRVLKRVNDLAKDIKKVIERNCSNGINNQDEKRRLCSRIDNILGKAKGKFRTADNGKGNPRAIDRNFNPINRARAEVSEQIDNGFNLPGTPGENRKKSRRKRSGRN